SRPEPQHFRLRLRRKDRHPPRALNLVLPPSNQPIMMCRRQTLQPQRILHHRIRSQPPRIPVSAQKCIDRFERHFYPSQSERRVRPRIQPDITQLVIVQYDLPLRPIQPRHLRISRRIGTPIPIRHDADRRPVHRPHHQRPVWGGHSCPPSRANRGPRQAWVWLDGVEKLGITQRPPFYPINFNRPKSSNNHIFQYLLYQGAKRIVWIRRLEIFGQRLDPPCAIRNLLQHPPTPRLDAPAHPHNPILNDVDRPPSDRSLCKPPQISRSRLRHQIVWGVVWGGHSCPPRARHLHRLRRERSQVRPRSRRPPPIPPGQQIRGKPLPQRHFSHPAHRAAHPLSNVHESPVSRGDGLLRPSNRAALAAFPCVPLCPLWWGSPPKQNGTAFAVPFPHFSANFTSAI